ncbi:MAG TPA: hypothetical protein VHM30_01665 [Gemmatimonadaceae bacterium]|nr:hypothetical protein [Gemmatimonadaceae bacterium]
MTRKLLTAAAVAVAVLSSRLGAQELPSQEHVPTIDDPWCWSIGSSAQSCSFNLPVHLTVPHVLQMYTPDVSTEFGDIGWGKWVPGPKLYAWANTDWDISVKAATPNFTGPATKSASTLYVYVPSPFRFESVANPVTLQSGSMGFTALDEFNLYTYTNVYTDAPGDYSIDLVYTMTGR